MAVSRSYVWPRPWVDVPEFRALRKAALEALDGLEVSSKALDPHSRLGACRFSVRKASQEEVDYLEKRLPSFGAEGAIPIALECSDLDLEAIGAEAKMSDGSPISPEERLSVAQHFVASELERFLRGSIVLWNICYFGCLNTAATKTICGDTVVHGSGCDSRIIWAYNENDFIPRSSDLIVEPATALKWSSECDGYWDGVAKSNVQKAIALLTRAFGDHEKKEDYPTLLWAIAGLEALYCDNASSITHQIRKRAPLLVSDFDYSTLDRLIRSGYDFRSRMFHGDIPVESVFAERDDADSKHHSYKASEYSDFFMLLLTCSLRQCIFKGAQAISFPSKIKFN